MGQGGDRVHLVLGARYVSRDDVMGLLGSAGVVAGRVVEVDASGLVACSVECASVLVDEVLFVRGAKALVVRGASDEFAALLESDARARDVDDVVVIV